MLHLTEPSREDPRREAWIVAENLPEASQLQERHVPQDEERPFPAEPLDALPNGIRLVRQERVDLPSTPARFVSLPRHYPFGPYGRYILSNGYRFAHRSEHGTKETTEITIGSRGHDGLRGVVEYESGGNPRIP